MIGHLRMRKEDTNLKFCSFFRMYFMEVYEFFHIKVDNGFKNMFVIEVGNLLLIPQG